MNKSSEEEQAANYDQYVSIDGLYGLGTKANEYYLVDIQNKQETKLDGVTKAYVLPVKDEDRGQDFKGLFIQRDNVWYLANEKGEVVIELTDFEVTEQTNFVVRNKVLTVV